jgi:diadenosine tetraphosphate (Ap4A) HIT family hydrolase/5-methylcytosine-specific restriction endonuclease McrA
MSGPYQPIIIKCLLENGGVASLRSIAKELAANDPEAIDYYIEKLKVYPKQVLKNHGIASLEKDSFHFEKDISIESDEKGELIRIASDKAEEYYTKNPFSDFARHGWGNLRHKMITDHPYCALCGAKPSPDIMLDIDHILPVSKGGTDEPSNLQVLCHRCNRGKGNDLIKSAKEAHRDFRNPQDGCIFCSLEESRIIHQDDYVIVIKDKYPVTTGHTLIIPKRHVSKALDLTDIEMLSIFHMSKKITQELQNEDLKITGFNLGFNVGQDAGQTVFHVHFHIIPRRNGDVSEPTGGIRNIIPGKGKY